MSVDCSRLRRKFWTRFSFLWSIQSCSRWGCGAPDCCSTGRLAPEKLCWLKPSPRSAPWPSSGDYNTCLNLSSKYSREQSACKTKWTYWNVMFVFSVKGPELINMYVGQSEENIREGKSFCWFIWADFHYIYYLLRMLMFLSLSVRQCSVRPERLLPVLFSLMSWTLWLLIEATVETQEGWWTGQASQDMGRY